MPAGLLCPARRKTMRSLFRSPVVRCGLLLTALVAGSFGVRDAAAQSAKGRAARVPQPQIPNPDPSATGIPDLPQVPGVPRAANPNEAGRDPAAPRGTNKVASPDKPATSYSDFLHVRPKSLDAPATAQTPPSAGVAAKPSPQAAPASATQVAAKPRARGSATSSACGRACRRSRASRRTSRCWRCGSR